MRDRGVYQQDAGGFRHQGTPHGAARNVDEKLSASKSIHREGIWEKGLNSLLNKERGEKLGFGKGQVNLMEGVVGGRKARTGLPHPGWSN